MQVSEGEEEAALVLGTYRLLAELAQGGFGAVYLAEARGREPRELVALKELRPEFLEDDELVSLFQAEAELALRLVHPNIVRALEFGADGPRRFLAMEYLEGLTLSRIVRRAHMNGTPMATEAYAAVLVDVLDALAYAHGVAGLDGAPLGVVHHGMTPQKVVVTYDGRVKVIGFGLPDKDRIAGEARGNRYEGKLRFMAPEYVAGKTVDGRADLYAAGVMLWEAAAGAQPWEGRGADEVLQDLLAGSVPRLRDAHPGVDAALAAIVDRAMAADRETRYPTAAAMREDLSAWVDRELKLGADPSASPGRRALHGLLLEFYAEDRDRLTALEQPWSAGAREHTTATSDAAHAEQPLTGPMDASVRRLTAAAPPFDVDSERTTEEQDDVPASVAQRVTLRSSVPGSRRTNWLIFSVGAVAIVAVGAALAVAPAPAPVAASGPSLESRLSLPPAAGSTAGPRAPPAPAEPETAPAPVFIHVSPATARLYVDDALVTNPFQAARSRDGAPHRLRAEAPGFEAATRTVTFDGPDSIDIALERVPPRRARPPAGATRATSPARAPSPVMTPSKARRKVEIDANNPYVR